MNYSRTYINDYTTYPNPDDDHSINSFLIETYIDTVVVSNRARPGLIRRAHQYLENCKTIRSKVALLSELCDKIELRRTFPVRSMYQDNFKVEIDDPDVHYNLSTNSTTPIYELITEQKLEEIEQQLPTSLQPIFRALHIRTEPRDINTHYTEPTPVDTIEKRVKDIKGLFYWINELDLPTTAFTVTSLDPLELKYYPEQSSGYALSIKKQRSIVQRFSEIKDIKIVVEELDSNYNSVLACLRYNGFPIPTEKRTTEKKIELIEAGYNSKELANIFGTTINAIQTFANRHGLKMKRVPAHTEEDYNIMDEAYEKYKTLREAVKHIPYGRETISKRWKEKGLSPGIIKPEDEKIILNAFKKYDGNIRKASRETGFGRQVIKRRWKKKGYLN